jgi:broad specificity phosphatase PhoE
MPPWQPVDFAGPISPDHIMDSPTSLFLIRHGEVEHRYHRVFGGRIDMELSPFGHEQATALANYLQRFPFQAIYASPMRRVQQTLKKLVEENDPLPQILPGLREVDFGVWTGLSWEQVKALHHVSAFDWLRLLENGSIPEAEPISQFRDRIQECLARILSESPGRSVAVVCHGGVIRMLLSLILDLPLPKLAAFDIEYASVSIVDYLPHKKEVQLLNFTPWRDA